jgi:hypothetical protein
MRLNVFYSASPYVAKRQPLLLQSDAPRQPGGDSFERLPRGRLARDAAMHQPTQITTYDDLDARLSKRLPGLRVTPPKVVICKHREFARVTARDWFNNSIGLFNCDDHPNFSRAPALMWRILAAPFSGLAYLLKQIWVLLSLKRVTSAFDLVLYLPSIGEIRAREDAERFEDFGDALRTAVGLAALHQSYPRHFADMAHMMTRGYSRQGDPEIGWQCRNNALKRVRWTVALAFGCTAPNIAEHHDYSEELQRRIQPFPEGNCVQRVCGMLRNDRVLVGDTMYDSELLDAACGYTAGATRVLTTAKRRNATLAKIEAAFGPSAMTVLDCLPGSPFVMAVPAAEVPGLED